MSVRAGSGGAQQGVSTQACTGMSIRAAGSDKPVAPCGAADGIGPAGADIGAPGARNPRNHCPARATARTSAG
jgi:hypothetical protein